MVFDRIPRPIIRSKATQADALDISEAFDKLFHAGVLHKLMFYALLGHFSVTESLEWLWMGCFHKNILAGVAQDSLLGRTLFLLFL